MSTLDVTPDVPSEPDPDRVAALTGHSRDWVEAMLIDRRGDHHDSNMTAIGLHRVVTASEAYRVSAEQGLLPVADLSTARDLESAVAAARTNTRPPHTAGPAYPSPISTSHRRSGPLVPHDDARRTPSLQMLSNPAPRNRGHEPGIASHASEVRSRLRSPKALNCPSISTCRADC